MTTGLVGQNIKDGTITDADVATANKDGAAGTACMRTIGTGAQQSCGGTDGRLSDARPPTAHKDGHKSGGGDQFLSSDLLEAQVKRILENGGQALLVGLWPDGTVLTRSGTSAVGGMAFVGTSKLTVGTAAPGSPNTGDLWCDTN